LLLLAGLGRGGVVVIAVAAATRRLGRRLDGSRGRGRSRGANRGRGTAYEPRRRRRLFLLLVLLLLGRPLGRRLGLHLFAQPILCLVLLLVLVEVFVVVVLLRLPLSALQLRTLVRAQVLLLLLVGHNVQQPWEQARGFVLEHVVERVAVLSRSDLVFAEVHGRLLELGEQELSLVQLREGFLQRRNEGLLFELALGLLGGFGLRSQLLGTLLRFGCSSRLRAFDTARLQLTLLRGERRQLLLLGRARGLDVALNIHAGDGVIDVLDDRLVCLPLLFLLPHSCREPGGLLFEHVAPSRKPVLVAGQLVVLVVLLLQLARSFRFQATQLLRRLRLLLGHERLQLLVVHAIVVLLP
jgi:hypothetical protein